MCICCNYRSFWTETTVYGPIKSDEGLFFISVRTVDYDFELAGDKIQVMREWAELVQAMAVKKAREPSNQKEEEQKGGKKVQKKESPRAKQTAIKKNPSPSGSRKRDSPSKRRKNDGDTTNVIEDNPSNTADEPLDLETWEFTYEIEVSSVSSCSSLSSSSDSDDDDAPFVELPTTPRSSKTANKSATRQGKTQLDLDDTGKAVKSDREASADESRLSVTNANESDDLVEHYYNEEDSEKTYRSIKDRKERVNSREGEKKLVRTKSRDLTAQKKQIASKSQKGHERQRSKSSTNLGKWKQGNCSLFTNVFTLHFR